MEPMALGSPPSSPASANVNPNFLPSFLIGDSQPSTPNPNTSPGRNRTPNLKVGFGTPSEARNLRQKLFNQSQNETNYSQSPYNNVFADKSGPPKQGLFDTVELQTTPILNSTMQTYAEHPGLTPNESFSRIVNDSTNYNPGMSSMNESVNRSVYMSPHMQSTLHTGKSDRMDSLWITVFGFPPSATSLVLAQLANCGCIIEKKFPTQGNWVHLKYSSYHDVAKALCLNGKLISSNIMVGIVLYHNKQDKENIDSAGVTSPNRARSLRQSFVSPQNSNNVITPVVPQKSTGLVTKAMEYVFGW